MVSSLLASAVVTCCAQFVLLLPSTACCCVAAAAAARGDDLVATPVVLVVGAGCDGDVVDFGVVVPVDTAGSGPSFLAFVRSACELDEDSRQFCPGSPLKFSSPLCWLSSAFLVFNTAVDAGAGCSCSESLEAAACEGVTSALWLEATFLVGKSRAAAPWGPSLISLPEFAWLGGWGCCSSGSTSLSPGAPRAWEGASLQASTAICCSTPPEVCSDTSLSTSSLDATTSSPSRSIVAEPFPRTVRWLGFLFSWSVVQTFPANGEEGEEEQEEQEAFASLLQTSSRMLQVEPAWLSVPDAVAGSPGCFSPPFTTLSTALLAC
mmetsp:Transcript_7693/g.13675  ORF Transcript_7693/g.13675 Transcript_7693/m.13675 type:complete len:321 (+) Transcript_7693:384-1346(+)